MYSFVYAVEFRVSAIDLVTDMKFNDHGVSVRHLKLMFTLLIDR